VTNPIWFTSALDTATTLPLGAPGATGAHVGDWNAIQFNFVSAASVMANTVVRYSTGGIVITGPADNAVPSLNANIFADNATGLQLPLLSATITVSGQTFLRNGIGLQVSGGTVSANSNTFTSNTTGISIKGGTAN